MKKNRLMKEAADEMSNVRNEADGRQANEMLASKMFCETWRLQKRYSSYHLVVVECRSTGPQNREYVLIDRQTHTKFTLKTYCGFQVPQNTFDVIIFCYSIGRPRKCFLRRHNVYSRSHKIVSTRTLLFVDRQVQEMITSKAFCGNRRRQRRYAAEYLREFLSQDPPFC